MQRPHYNCLLRPLAVIVGLSLIITPLSAYPEETDHYTGDDFKKDCLDYEYMKKLTGDFSGRTAGYCLGYFTAVLENSTGFCLPKGINNRRVHQKMKRFLKEETELLELDAVEVIQRGLKQAFPCHNNVPAKK